MTLYNTTFENFNNSYMGSAAMAIIAQSCLGGIAAMFILSNGTSAIQMIQLGIIVLASVFANTSILAQVNHKIVFNLVLTSVCLSLLLILTNTIL